MEILQLIRVHKRFLIILTAILLGSFPLRSFAYDGSTVHPFLTKTVITYYNQLHPNRQISAADAQQIIAGSTAEDQSPRYANHFYDPINHSGLTGKDFGNLNPATAMALIVSLVGTHPEASIDWANDQYSQSRYLFYGGNLTWNSSIYKIAHGDATGYYALGSVLHLLEDLTVPEHTRDDGHGIDIHIGNIQEKGSPYEDWTAIHYADKPLTVSSADFSSTQCSSLTDCFNNTALYTSTHFFSEETFDEYQNPKIYTREENTKEIYYMGTDEQNNLFNLAYFNKENNKPELTTKNDLVLSDYWDRLSKESIVSGVHLLEDYFTAVDRVQQHQETIVPPNLFADAVRSNMAYVISTLGNGQIVRDAAIDVGNSIASFFKNSLGNISFSKTGNSEEAVQPKTSASQQTSSVTLSSSAPALITQNRTGSSADQNIIKTETQTASASAAGEQETGKLETITENQTDTTRDAPPLHAPYSADENIVRHLENGGDGQATLQDDAPTTPMQTPSVPFIFGTPQKPDDQNGQDDTTIDTTPSSSPRDTSGNTNNADPQPPATPIGFSATSPARKTILLKWNSPLNAAYPEGTFFDMRWSTDLFDLFTTDQSSATPTFSPEKWQSYPSITAEPFHAHIPEFSTTVFSFETTVTATPNSTWHFALTTTYSTSGQTLWSPPATSAAVRVNADADHVVINQILTGTADNPKAEFIELYNPTAEPVDLSSYAIQYLSASSSTGKFSKKNLCDSCNISPYGYFLIATPEFAATAFATLPDTEQSTLHLAQNGNLFLTHSTAALSFSTSAQSIEDPSAITDQISWGEGTTIIDPFPAPAPTYNQSLQRKYAYDTTTAEEDEQNIPHQRFCTDNSANDFFINASPATHNGIAIPRITTLTAKATPDNLDGITLSWHTPNVSLGRDPQFLVYYSTEPINETTLPNAILLNDTFAITGDVPAVQSNADQIIELDGFSYDTAPYYFAMRIAYKDDLPHTPLSSPASLLFTKPGDYPPYSWTAAFGDEHHTNSSPFDSTQKLQRSWAVQTDLSGVHIISDGSSLYVSDDATAAITVLNQQSGKLLRTLYPPDTARLSPLTLTAQNELSFIGISSKDLSGAPAVHPTYGRLFVMHPNGIIKWRSGDEYLGMFSFFTAPPTPLALADRIIAIGSIEPSMPMSRIIAFDTHTFHELGTFDARALGATAVTAAAAENGDIVALLKSGDFSQPDQIAVLGNDMQSKNIFPLTKGFEIFRNGFFIGLRNTAEETFAVMLAQKQFGGLALLELNTATGSLRVVDTGSNNGSISRPALTANGIYYINEGLLYHDDGTTRIPLNLTTSARTLIASPYRIWYLSPEGVASVAQSDPNDNITHATISPLDPSAAIIPLSSSAILLIQGNMITCYSATL